MDLRIYGDDSKALIRFDPRTKLFIFLSCGVTSLYTYSGLYILLFAGAVCAVLALSGKLCNFRFMRYETDAGVGWDRSRSI